MPSFSRTVKEEITFNEFDDDCSKALLCAFIKVVGTLNVGRGLMLVIRTENAKIASMTHRMLKRLYDPKIEFAVSRKMKLHKNNVYYLRVSKAQEILNDLDLLSDQGFLDQPTSQVVFSIDTKRAYLAGSFLACGSVNNPETANYHLELSVDHLAHATYIQSLMNENGLNAKIIKRRNKHVVYLKSAERIGDFLRAIGAGNSVMSFEMTRIDRNMSNTVNRWNNCDIANLTKAMEASKEQVESIGIVMDRIGLEALSEKMQYIARLRLENQEATLQELCEIYEEETGESISKATMHRHFKKIKDLAIKAIEMERES